MTDDNMPMLPPELETWQKDHMNVIGHIHDALKEAEAPVTERQLWNLIARTYSPAWAHAWFRLNDADQKISIHKSDENRALGAIGMALESNTINKELSASAEALAVFTIIDEELRQDPDLKTLLTALVENQRMLEESIKISRGVADVNAAFAEVASPTIVKVSYTSPLQGVFGKMARKVFPPAKRNTDMQPLKR